MVKQSIPELNLKKKIFLILDSSVGDGRFLSEFYNIVKANPSFQNEVNSFRFFGLDIDPNAIKLAIIKSNNIPKEKISIKEGNALVGHLRSPIEYKKNWSDGEINESLTKSINYRKSTISKKIKPFHWFKEWPQFVTNDGFDIIIGNPPYGITFSNEEKRIFKNVYQAYDPELESYLLFIERSVYLLREGGVMAYLVPNNIATNFRYQNIRRFLLDNIKILRIINFEKKLFPGIHVESSILIMQRSSFKSERMNNNISFEIMHSKNVKTQKFVNTILQKEIKRNSLHMFIPQPQGEINSILEKIKEKAIPLGELVSISRGIELGFKSSITSREKINSEYVPLIAGRLVHKFKLDMNQRYIKFDSANKAIFKNENIYLSPQKLFLRRIGHELVCALDENQKYCVCDVYILISKETRQKNEILYIEGLLNSKLLLFFFKYSYMSVKNIFPKIPINFLKHLPIIIPNSLGRIIGIVNDLNNLNWKENNQKILYEKYIEELNKEVFKIYNISSEEQNNILLSLK
jgi:hypothetical protein